MSAWPHQSLYERVVANPGDLRLTADHLLCLVLYVLAGGIAVGVLVTLLGLYSDNLRRTKQANSRKKTPAPTPAARR